MHIPTLLSRDLTVLLRHNKSYHLVSKIKNKFDIVFKLIDTFLNLEILLEI